MASDSPRVFPQGIAAPTEVRPTPQIPDHQLLRRVGLGSYGEVWLARNVMGTYRAVKVVYRNAFEHERPYEREFDGIRKFEPISRRHDSQVDILHIGRDDPAGYFYYVMELADDASNGEDTETPGGKTRRRGETQRRGTGDTERRGERALDPERYVPRTLKWELNRRGRLPFEECLRIGLALTTALEHLHSHQLVHRDIKPSNIIFVEGLPKLADIGLVTSLDQTLSMVGTVGYVPPEGAGTPQADIYSLGKVLYETSLGQECGEFPRLPAGINEFADSAGLLELNAILLRACQTDPHKRYQSAGQMHADLVLLQSGKSVRRLHQLERCSWALRWSLG